MLTALLPWLLNAIYVVLIAAYLPVMLYKRWRYGKHRARLRSSLGWMLRDLDRAKFANGCIWVHAVSVGEVVAAKALLPHLKAAYPALPIILSTTTETGQEQAKRAFPNADAIIYYPLDLSWVVNRFLNFFRPRLFVLLESEIWPNFLMALKRRGIPAILVNGKVSKKSYRAYRLAGPWLRPAFGGLTKILTQSSRDVRRYKYLTKRPADVGVCGNLKFDSLPTPMTPERRAKLLEDFGLDDARPIILAGSTHPGEEEPLLAAWLSLRNDAMLPLERRPRLILCPRHPERFDAVWRATKETLTSAGIDASLARRATIAPNATTPELLLLDKMGVLAESFGLARVAWLGGSWAPIGGHSLLEPAAHGTPVIVGPHLHAQGEIVRIMRRGAALNVVEANALAEFTRPLLADDAAWHDAATKARTTVEAQRGVAERAMRAIGELLPA